MDNPNPSALARIMTARDRGLAVRVAMTVSGPLLGLFALFGRGVAMDVAGGCTIQALVCGQLGIAADYLAGSIQTVFLDGRAVDGIETVVVPSGSVLALSAAMPGLVGATMRRNGRYASLRGNITFTQNEDACNRQGAFGTILVKLFNQVARDLAADFLVQGVWVEGDRFADFIKAQPPGAIEPIAWDGDTVTTGTILSADWHDRAVLLSARL